MGCVLSPKVTFKAMTVTCSGNEAPARVVNSGCGRLGVGWALDVVTPVLVRRRNTETHGRTRDDGDTG